MFNQSLRDAHGRMIGMLEAKPNGLVDIREAREPSLGCYDSHANIPEDHHGRIVGPGNGLVTLMV